MHYSFTHSSEICPHNITATMKILPYTPEIRFFDIDAMGHVNNSVYFSYFEMARVHFFGQLIGRNWNWRKNGVLVAHNEIDYLHPILFEDAINIYVSVLKVGTKSFTLGYEIKSGEKIFATGKSVMVTYDFINNHTTEIPTEYKGLLEQLLVG